MFRTCHQNGQVRQRSTPITTCDDPPPHRKPLPQHVHSEFRWLPTVDDCLHDIRRQQRQHHEIPLWSFSAVANSLTDP